MFRTKKLQVVLTGLLCLIVLMVGCSNGTNNNTSDASKTNNQPTNEAKEPASTPVEPEVKAPVTLTLAHGWTGEVAMAAAFEPAVERFIATHDYITLDVETAPGNGIREKIVAEMAANDAPDVFLHWGVRDTESYIINDKIADLTDLINGDPDLNGRYIENAYDSATYQGKIYGLPIEANMMNFLVNEKMFEEHGVKIPGTFDELLEAVAVFKSKKLIPIAANDGTTRAVLANMNDQLYGQSVKDNLVGKTVFDVKLQQAAENVKRLIDAGAFPEGMETMGTLQALEMFNAEMAPMYYQHSWTLGSVAEEIIDQVQVIPFPKLTADGKSYMTAGVGYFVYISQRAYEDESKREAAWELAKFLAGPEVGQDLEVIAGNPSPVKWDRLKEIHPILSKALKLRDSGDVATFPDHNDLLSREASVVYNDLKTRLYLKDITPEQYAESFRAGIQANPNLAFQ